MKYLVLLMLLSACSERKMEWDMVNAGYRPERVSGSEE